MGYKNRNGAGETPMLNSINDNNNPLIIPTKDSPKHMNPLKKEGELSAEIRIAFSNKAQELNMLEGDSPLTEVLKDEFNEVFEFGGDKGKSFRRKVDHIFVNSGL